MASLDTRLAQVERHRTSASMRHAQIAKDANTVTGKLLELAARFDDDDAALDPAVLARWSGAMRTAWAMRFAPEQVSEIVAEYVA